MLKKLVLALCIALAVGSAVHAGDVTATGYSMKDLVAFLTASRHAINNRNLSIANVTYNLSTSTYLAASATTAVVEGVITTTTATNTISFTSGHTSLGARKACVFGLCVNSSGVYSTIQGGVVDSTSTPANPAMVADKALIGTVKVVTNSTGVFVPGTTGLDNASCTVTFYQMSHIPVSLTGL